MAVRSDLDRQRDPEEAPRRHDRLKQGLARYLSELGWGDERYEDPREYCGPFRTATSLASFSASLSDALDTARSFTSCTLSYTTVNSWRPWMLMGETPGTITWRLMGRKLRSPTEVGEPLLSWLQQDHPDLLES